MRGRVLAIDTVGQDVDAVERLEPALQPRAELQCTPHQSVSPLEAPTTLKPFARGASPAAAASTCAWEGEPAGT